MCICNNTLEKDIVLNIFRKVYFENVKLQGEDNSLINEIKELVQFSIPQVQTRVNHGYKILRKNRHILF